MFTINSFADVVAVAKTFGNASLKHITTHHTMSVDVERLIFDCQQWACSTVINLENVNDGNIEYSVDAVYTYEQVGTDYYTGLQDVTIIRTGFGSYTVSVREAMEKGYINAELLKRIMTEIHERNEASKWLYC